MIQFGAGQGVVGRSVFQKLREFRKLHELQWGWQAEEFKRLNKRERGERIHDQKPNAVADIAAVLAGAGRGNLMWTEQPEPVQVEKATSTEDATEDFEATTATETARAIVHSISAETQVEKDVTTSDATEVPLTTTPSAPAQADATAIEKAPKVGKKKTKQPAPAGPKRLRKATIYWANDMDLEWARKWSGNVIHELGLPEGVKVWNWKTKTIRETDYETTEAKADSTTKPATGERGQAVEKGEEKKEEKKGWFGWFGGKASSSQEARV